MLAWGRLRVDTVDTGGGRLSGRLFMRRTAHIFGKQE